MGYTNAATKTVEEQEVDVITSVEKSYQIIVWNDEVNTFEWVIETLMEIWDHSTEQAEQCAMIIHTKGKYAVQQGTYETLKPKVDAITDRGIGATLGFWPADILPFICFPFLKIQAILPVLFWLPTFVLSCYIVASHYVHLLYCYWALAILEGKRLKRRG